MLSDRSASHFRILVVCLGNVCRSPLAERLLARELERAGCTAYEVGSAGVIGLVGRPMHPDAAAQLEALGGTSDGFRARRVTAGLVASADLVLTATTDVRRSVVEQAPAAMRRTFTLREFALLADGAADVLTPAELVADCVRRRGTVAGADLDVPDPMGGPVEAHRVTALLIAEAVHAIAGRLTAIPPDPAHSAPQ